MQSDLESIVAQLWLLRSDVLTRIVRDTSENENLFIIFVVTNDTKAVIADVVKPLTLYGVFDIEPDFLVKQENRQIV